MHAPETVLIDHSKLRPHSPALNEHDTTGLD
jgi:hypothetical protein